MIRYIITPDGLLKKSPSADVIPDGVGMQEKEEIVDGAGGLTTLGETLEVGREVGR